MWKCKSIFFQTRLFLTVPTSMLYMYVYFRFFGLICTDRSCHCGTNLTEKVSNQKITSYFTVNRGISMKYLFEINDFYKQSWSPIKPQPKISKKLLITNFVNISGIAIFHCLARILIEVQVFCFEYIKINQSERCISLVFTEKIKTVIFQLVLYLHLYSGKDVVYEQEENHNFLSFYPISRQRILK